MKYEVEGLQEYTIKDYKSRGNKIKVFFVDKKIKPQVIKVNSRAEKIEVLKKLKAKMLVQASAYVENTNHKKLSGAEARDHKKYRFYLNNESLFSDSKGFKLCRIRHHLKRVENISINDVDRYSLSELKSIKGKVEANKEARELVKEIVKRR